MVTPDRSGRPTGRHHGPPPLSSLAWFTFAAVAEIAGCFALWAWLRGGASPAWLVPGVACLLLFAVALTRVDSAFAGRAYAAYGGIYIAASLVWLWAVERQPPDRFDLLGSAVAIAGAAIVLLGPRP